MLLLLMMMMVMMMLMMMQRRFGVQFGHVGVASAAQIRMVTLPAVKVVHFLVT